MTVVVTGANGFIGNAVIRELQKRGINSRSVLRISSSAQKSKLNPHAVVVVPSLNKDTDWTAALAEAQVVVHCAGIAHINRKITKEAHADFRSVNVDGTLQLARQAAAARVRRFIFISSIGVNGIETFGRPFAADDIPNPQEPYAQSKWEAEQGLQMLAAKTKMELVILRPPMVYGQRAPGNFGRLVSSVQRGIWLPLGAIDNRRTLVALDNLIDLIIICIEHPNAAGQIFLAGDAEDLSTTDLLRRLAHAAGRPARLLRVPEAILKLAGRLSGHETSIRKICGDLQVDIRKTCDLLNWTPPISVDEGLRRVVSKPEIN